MIVLHQLGSIKLLDVRADSAKEWEPGDATNIRVTMPANTQTEIAMQKRGYFLADRTLGVSILLRRTKIDYNKMVRMELEESLDHSEDVLRIAVRSFRDDRRFHVCIQPNEDVARCILSKWVSTLEQCLLCRYKDKVIGFLALQKLSDSERFIRLAAVEEEYRLTGAALSLYAGAAMLCKDQGIEKLSGRVSTRNYAVMNLYSYLGGTFSEPEDIFLKEMNA